MPQMSASPVYRWNTTDFADGYDEAAPIVHPHYAEVQDAILASLPQTLAAGGLVVDLGGGSGRLVERILANWPQAQAIIIDQSEPFLALAERRLARFGLRASCLLSRLQDAWEAGLAERPVAIVSMSAIHHLEPHEKKSLYARCFQALAAGGVLLNGDEVRAAEDDAYFASVSAWAEHMRWQMASGRIPGSFHEALHGWIARNVTRFGEPKKSGDDCHETIEAQLAYLRDAGFSACGVPWQRDLWAVLCAQRADYQPDLSYSVASRSG
jgi:cyclopropane fatty-acyl-phospholipid synthase-like methyltransferase